MVSNYIPKIHYIGTSNEHEIIVMDFIGMTLQKYFNNFNKKIPLSTIKKIGIEILNILEYIHSKNIIHRDIKTGCFLIDSWI